MNLHIVILGAGKGSRMKSSLPKVLHRLANKPLVQHVIDSASSLHPEQTHVVIGHGADIVRKVISGEHLSFALQTEQLGTGHAVAQAMPDVPDDATVLILYGDVPLTRTESMQRLLNEVSATSMALMTITLDDPMGYGRIVRDDAGRVQSIVEQKDASKDQLLIKEVNTGIMAVRASHLNAWLPRLQSDNAQQEYYLTDIIAMAINDGVDVSVVQPDQIWEVEGVNTLVQLEALERCHQRNQAEKLMLQGVRIIDAARFDLRGSLDAGLGCEIDVNCVFEGDVSMGDNVYIGPNCVIKDSTIASGTRIEANSILDNVQVGEKVTIGPFARLRPGTVLSNNAKIGNFVETKKTTIGEGSKINHLSYVGDATLGAGVNVGAGTITCNYDGVNKFQTVLEDGVFVGSNSSLVAPVKAAKGATIGAGSVITKDIEENQLAVARGKQRNIDGWDKPKKQS